MSGSFFWLALFPMIFGGILFVAYILFLRREAKKPERSEIGRITPSEFINEVAQFSEIDHAKAERVIEFIFSYFPGFNWKNSLPKMRDRKRNGGNGEVAKKGKIKNT